MTHPIQVTVLSSSEVEREGICRILTEHAFDVVSAFPDHHAFGESPALSSPDGTPIVLINQGPGDDLLESCRQIKGGSPDCKVVVFSADCRSDAIVEAFKAGVDGYIDKQTSCAGLAKMLMLVALGEKVMPSQPFLDLQIFRNDGTALDMPMGSDEAALSDRELDILRGLIRGEANKIIARQSAITEATVKVHVKSILRKVGVANRTQAAIWGLSRGLGALPKSPVLDSARFVGSPD